MPPCAPAPLCRHLRTDGAPCGAPALRGKPVCFYHDAARQPLAVTRDLGRVLPNLPAPDDLHAIQIGYSQLLRLIAADEIAPRTATLLLRTLAHASQNLARIHRRERTHPAEPVTRLVLDPVYGPLAPENEPETQQDQYFTDFEQAEALAQPAPPSRPHLAVGVAAPQPEPNAAGTSRFASETWASPGAQSTPVTGPETPTPTPRPAPELPAAPPLTALTLAEQYVLADREHTLSPAAHNTALAAITARLLHPTPEDRERDRSILAARSQAQATIRQSFTENKESQTAPETLALVHAAAA